MAKNFCQNLWETFGRAELAQKHCVSVLDVFVKHGGELGAVKESVAAFEASIKFMNREWDNCYGELPNGERVFGPELEALMSIAQLMESEGTGPWSVERLLPVLDIGDDHVTKLNLRNFKIKHLKQLNRLHYLESIIMRDMQLTDTTLDLSNLARLDTAILNHCKLTKVTGLDSAKDLQILALEGNPVSDLPDLSGHAKLMSINIVGTNIASLECVRGSKSLENLKISLCPIADLSPVEGLEKLKLFVFKDVPGARNLDFLRSLPNIQHLGFSGDKITDLSPIADIPILQGLDMGVTGITDFSVLRSLKELSGLTINDSNFTDATPLAEMSELKFVYLEGSGVVDLKPFLKLPALRYLDIKNTPAVLHDKETIESLLSAGVTVKT